MKETTTGKDLRKSVKTCMTELELFFFKTYGLTSDGAPAMTGMITGAVTLEN